ncbi:hypothetical protein ACIQ1H_05095 [Lysinibacillus sp. NPDC097279]|uniref:hypothetical protein n=1 Tax=Lysinibacillus sp. NPDC097279 TaxID=3364143 RepID=UPI00382BE413
MTKNFTWYAPNGELLKCPVPGCHHIGTIITKKHCWLAHGMSRDEVGKKYGKPKRILIYSKNQIKARDEEWVNNT